jgi:hypothetical protein
MDLRKAQGVAMVVRVIAAASKDSGFTIFAIIHDRGKGKIVTYETRAEAGRATR